MADASKRETIDRSIRNGNRPIVTVKKDGEETKMFLETAPRYSQVNLYNLDGRSEKRGQFMKPEKEIKLSVEKSVKKDKKQEQGLTV